MAAPPPPKPSKPTIEGIYEILERQIKKSNHKYKNRLKRIVDILRRGGDDRVIQWNHIMPAESRYGPTAGMIGGMVPQYMPMLPKHAALHGGVDDIWIKKNIKSISDVEGQPTIRSMVPFGRFVTSINWELKEVQFGGKMYERSLMMIFTHIHRNMDDSYKWLDAWDKTTLLWSSSSMGAGYKAIYKWNLAQSHKSNSPIYSIRTIKN